MSYPPSERRCYKEASRKNQQVVPVEHVQDFPGRTAHDFPDADFLAAVFTFEQGQSEDADYADDDGQQGKQEKLPDKPEFVAVGIVQNLVDEPEIEVGKYYKRVLAKKNPQFSGFF